MTAPAIVVVTYPVTYPTPTTTNPCVLGRHRWAWLVDGRQACGYCEKARP